jgi:hypothetical protein
VIESGPKGQVTKLLREQLIRYVILRIEDTANVGVPDTIVTGGGQRITSWWEFKHANPHIKKRPSQELMMRRLGNVGRAFYVIFESEGRDRWTRIVEPKDYAMWKTSGIIRVDFDYQYVVDFIRGIHEP